MHSNDTLSVLTAYFAALIGYLQDVEWTTVGAVILLIARLIVDVPPAIRAIKDYWKKLNAKRNSNR